MSTKVKKLKYLTYKNYVGSLEYNPKSGMYSGHIKLIPAFLHYVAMNKLEAEVRFREKVDEYLLTYHRIDRNKPTYCKDYRRFYD